MEEKSYKLKEYNFNKINEYKIFNGFIEMTDVIIICYEFIFLSALF